MIELEAKGLNELIDRWDTALAAMPQVKYEILHEAGERLRTNINARIGGKGKVKSWQMLAVGSGRGYVAVRPMWDDFGMSYFGWSFINIANYTYIGITTAIERGHRVRPRFGKDKEHSVLRKSMFVPGKHMYKNSQKDANFLARNVADRISKQLISRLEG